MTEKVAVDVNELVTLVVAAVQATQAGSGAAATNAAASAGTARTTSNAEQDAKDAFKGSFVAEQIDSDTGAEESYQAQINYWRDMASLNGKRTYDVHQTVDLENWNSLRNKQNQLDQVTMQNLINATETHNLAAKQALRHSDIAIHAQWEDKGVDDGANEA